MAFRGFFNNKRVLVTGHTGFKGSWLSVWLARLGAIVSGFSLAPLCDRDHYTCVRSVGVFDDETLGDVRDSARLARYVQGVRPDIIFHLAAQALVSRSYSDPIETWSTNVVGTQNLLEAVRKLDKACRVVIVTSDKCYENKEWPWGYRETDELGGSDPYSASKAAVEVLVSSYARTYFSQGEIHVGVGRAGNVIGGGDWSVDRLIPDLMRAFETADAIKLRNPESTRPWQHVLEPLSGYLSLAESLPSLYSDADFIKNIAFNFGPDGSKSLTVREVIDQIEAILGRRLSVELVRGEFKESSLLKLSSDRAYSSLGWQTTLSSGEAISITAEWYRDYFQTPNDAFTRTVEQIAMYEDLARERSIKWARR